jgi:hypothetical protein
MYNSGDSHLLHSNGGPKFRSTELVMQGYYPGSGYLKIAFCFAYAFYPGIFINFVSLCESLCVI